MRAHRPWVPYRGDALGAAPQARGLEAPAFATVVTDTFDFTLEECSRRPLVTGVAIHPYLVGHPHRLVRLERALRYVIERADGRVRVTTASAIDTHHRKIDP